jgi:hypothetical protein
MHDRLAALAVGRHTSPDWHLTFAGDLSSEACAVLSSWSDPNRRPRVGPANQTRQRALGPYCSIPSGIG